MPLTMPGLINAIERLEANLEHRPERRDELMSVAVSICAPECDGYDPSVSDVELVLWRWLGEPGRPLIDAGLVDEQSTVEAFFRPVGPSCTGACVADTNYLHELVARLWDQGLLIGLGPEGPAPSDLAGVAPFWSATLWHPAGALCLDPENAPRYGMFDGRTCVSPELDSELRRDVARHELGHVWVAWARDSTLLHQDESDVDCWAYLHGATWLNYLPSGCDSEEHQNSILSAYAASIGLAIES